MPERFICVSVDGVPAMTCGVPIRVNVVPLSRLYANCIVTPGAFAKVPVPAKRASIVASDKLLPVVAPSVIWK